MVTQDNQGDDYKEAQARIEDARISEADTLDLMFLGLIAVPPEIVQLTNLTSLYLNDNQLTAIPPRIDQLINLTTLELDGNQLTAVFPEIGQLTNLTSLYLDRNELTAVPPEIGQLTNLTVLSLTSNQLTAVPSEIVQLTNLTELNLGFNKLTAFPPEIAQLSNLRTLSLNDNGLTAVSPEVGQLENLTELNLHNNELKAIPPEIGQLTNLTELYLGDNQLTAVPAEIGQLTNLIKLYLFGSQLTAVLPKIGQLTNLTTLSLNDNQLTAVSPEIGQLTNLIKLYLDDNQLTALPSEIGQLTNLTEFNLNNNELAAVPEWLAKMPQLEKLYIFSNPITQPPPELLEEALGNPDLENFVDLEAVRRYYTQLADEGEAQFYEAKLLLIGESGAGKTSLARKLLNPAATLPAANESTKGVDVTAWEFNAADQISDDQRYTANIWDFGGQEIYHATHQFFLTRRSLYILVADAREQKTDFDYWLHAVKTLSDASPLLIVVNEKEGQTWHIDSGRLNTLFGNLIGTLTVDLKSGVGLSHLTETIQRRLLDLPHIGDPLPRTWVNVRGALEELQEKAIHHISRETYLAICEEQGIAQLADKLQLSGYLHDLGVILHFQDDDILQRTVILNPEWGTDAVYRVLDNKQVLRNQGRFNRADLDAIWHEDEYALMRPDLLALMMKFQLCYEIVEQAAHYIAPQLLSQQPPDYDWLPTDNLILRYRAPAFMPKGIVSRFIVVMHKHIEAQQVWRNGVVLSDEFARAEVIETYHQREIKIRIVGSNQGDLLNRVTWELDKIFNSFHNLDYHKLVPCNCAECSGSQSPYFYRMASLKRRLSKNIDTVECDHSYEDVSVVSLIRNASGGMEAILQRELRRGGNVFNIDKYVGGDNIEIDKIKKASGIGIGGGASGSAG